MSERGLLVVGGGLAGLSLIDALLAQGADPGTLTLVDAAHPERGSSSPATVLHPFAGRTMAPGRAHWRAFLMSWSILQGWCERHGQGLWRQAPMMRLLSGDKLSHKLEESWDEGRAAYPEGVQVERVQGERSRELLPSWEGLPALLYEHAAAVDLPGLCEALLAHALARGVRLVSGQVQALRKGDEGWVAEVSGQAQAPGGARVVLATGALLPELMTGADLRERPGEVGVWPASAPLHDLKVMINSHANIFELPGGQVGVGSTYLRGPAWRARDAAQAADDLREKMDDALGGQRPGLASAIWRGVRGVYGSDHRPLVGAVAREPGLYVMAGFGSKGLTWAPAMGRVLAAHLLADAPLWEVIDARRAGRLELRR
ncbi:hypothetical protein DL240_07995 [Lujinxingia litoralis]|uniref:FAD dependent oxidoreductase domain-containing protein n=1 Tax=Lujinxingia litoralis TaxID=2211119 RepID=A0A328C9I6_9DELT|nr:FAD-dependent oxidoreductase [Lujinxingia litoralis]RAL22825.1 hypothetical protein DL240_07995 [Lujinxingia litoralis]